MGEVAYLINGVPINNPLNNSAAFDIETNMVSGLEVISGVFNAEYGQAMSGVVNIVTKDVPNKWNGSFSTEIGGIASLRELEYIERTAEPGSALNASDFESVTVPYSEAAGFPGRQDYQLSLGGPLIKDKLGIQFSGRYYYDEGNEIARRIFSPSDSSQNLNVTGPEGWIIESTGDQKFVSDFHRRYSLNSTLTYRITPKARVEYNGIFQRNNGWDLNAGNYHQNKYVPEGENRYYNRSQFHLAGLYLTLGAKAFADINYSYLRDQGQSYLYEIPDDFDSTGVLDARYQSGQLGSLTGTNAFAVGGNDLFNGKDLTETHALQVSFTQQLNRIHQIKAGASARLHHLWRGSYSIEKGANTGWVPMPSTDPFGRDTLDVRPYEWAAYAQDKMEFRNLIVNAGLRFDYFEPDYLIPVDWEQADSLMIPEYGADGEPTGNMISNRKQSPARYQLSPRIGIAFPISSSGVVRFSAGLFFQTPPFSILYQNPNYEVAAAASNVTFGNASLDPERTLHFEIGLQQGLTESLGLELTLFSKDIRNLVGVVVRRNVTGTAVVRYVNQDVGTSRGVTLSLFQRPVGPISWDIDYTLQFASGTASNPNEAFQRFQNNQEEIKTLVRLDWDRRHVLTNSITLTPSEGLRVSLINRFQTGSPYTSERRFIISYIENNENRPTTFNTDLRVSYRTPLLQRLGATLQVNNLFDTKNHNGVYNDTGRADESVQMELFRRNDTPVGGLNSLDEYYIEQWRFSGPRRVILGLTYTF